MIETIPFTIGFIILMIYTIITFNIYSKGKKINSTFMLILIFLFYISLASYVISFIDIEATFFEKSIQTFIYFSIGLIVLYFQYQDELFNSEKDYSDSYRL